jgi:hypothetical protein
VALSEQEEFELLSLERERAMAAAPKPSRFQETASKIGLGLLRGGPMGAVTAGVGEGLRGIDEVADTAGGAATDALASVSGRRSVLNPLGLEVPPEVAGAVGAITKTAIPALVGATGTTSVGKPVMEAGAKRLMHSALKPSAQSQVGGVNSDAAKAIQTMLDEGVNVSTGGALKMRTLINKLHGDVAKQIAASPASVNKGHVASELFETLNRFREQVTSNADEAAILKAWAEFNGKYGATIPVQKAQSLKQGTYGILADKYAKGGQPAIENEASTQAQMAMARGLRKGIEEVVPGVDKLNAREAALINALELAERRAGMAGNRDLAGIAWLAQNPGAAAAMLADRSPAFKSILARMMYRGKNVIPATAGGFTAAAAAEGEQ